MTGWSGARQRRRDRRFLLAALFISNALPGPLQGDAEGVNLSGSCVRAVIRWEIKRWPRDVRSNSTILPLHHPRKNSWICCRRVQTRARTGGALLSAAVHGGAGLGTYVGPCSSPCSAEGSLASPYRWSRPKISVESRGGQTVQMVMLRSRPSRPSGDEAGRRDQRSRQVWRA